MNDDSFEKDLRVVLAEGSDMEVSERLRASIAQVPEHAASGRLGSRLGFRGIAGALAVVASAVVVAAVIFASMFLRSNGTSPSAGNGASATPRVTCSELSEAACESVRAEVHRHRPSGIVYRNLHEQRLPWRSVSPDLLPPGPAVPRIGRGPAS